MSNDPVTLKYPIEVKSGVVVSSITLRRMKAKDFVHLPVDGTTTPYAMLPLLAALSGLDIEVIKELDVEDLSAITAKAINFPAAFPETGNTSSGG